VQVVGVSEGYQLDLATFPHAISRNYELCHFNHGEIESVWIPQAHQRAWGIQ
jgi:hypothetical protein